MAEIQKVNCSVLNEIEQMLLFQSWEVLNPLIAVFNIYQTEFQTRSLTKV
jgi:hypothetical protein